MKRIAACGFALVTALGALHASTARADDAVPQRSTVVVHVRSAPPEARIEKWEGDWRAVCEGTCDRELDVDATYRMNGSGIRESKSFHLDGKSGQDVTLDFERKSSGAHTTGIALTAVGSFFLAAGLGFGIATLAYMATPQTGNNGGPIAGIALGGLFSAGSTIVGLAMFIPGVVLMTKNGPSKIGAVGELPHQPSPVFGDARSQLPMPGFTSIPIFAGTF